MLRDSSGNSFFVFDAHTHIGRRTTPSLLRRDEDFDGSDMVASMDANGVDMVVAFPRMNPHTDYSEPNRRVLEFAREHPSRIVPYVRINPYYGEEATKQLHECAEQGARGLKLHPFMDFGSVPVNSRDLVFPLIEVAADHGLVVTIHSGEAWNCTPALIGDLAEQFPSVRFVVAHSGLWELHQEAIVTARRVPNLYLDTAEVAPPGVVANLVRGAGVDKVLYGSDHPMIPLGWELRKVAQYAGLSVEETRAVLGGNLLRILDLPAPDPSETSTVDIAEV
jgi:predicted TIM-barrel fold metal-dependent hydrolase